ncbi:proteasomal ubiquitin receptor ADRM1 isoform X1 [Ischnura elegans]|uniref:proteasomal ubiquitin receptor ADRM1 isoform X1 n=1 Tax=Ischnura elegans TaxID=197161 RepID=UPI001ED8B7C1|nr:proteasomal ubiquitin receptor ADRM1 isoform X1 [Ischnura elegans]XP_046383885.1 proteasomal ubiquitin receptor ADRM1 isoform X1 [Ischnura elegans]XP_046383887.1 proteasomal ubiquitin receptor ADRM1 isoform X1 [Ischnura elegans]
MAVGAALFGNTSSRSQSKNLVEFKAGKMTQKGKMVHPDKRKGLLYVYQSDDSLMHFCWKDRQTGAVEDDLIIFPDDCEYKRVNQCTTGRVYVLKFKSSNRNFFFWMQEPKTDKDDDHCRRVNEMLNNPPTPGSQRSGGGTPDGDLQNLLNNMSQQQLMQLFGGVGQIGGLGSLLGTMSRPSSSQASRSTSGGTSGASASSSTSSVTPTVTTTSAQPSATSNTQSTTAPMDTSTAAVDSSSASGSQSAIQLRDLQNFLSELNVPTSEENKCQVDLSSALSSESLQAALANPAIVRELQTHLPAISGSELQPSEQLRATLHSPQFQQALGMFSTALQSGQLGPVVQQFEVGDEAVTAAEQGNVEAFVKALQGALKEAESKDEKEKESKGSSQDKKEDEDDEGMSLD